MNRKTICWFMLALFAVFSAYSQQNVSAPQKFALVIGNGNYTSITKLNNPGNDALDIKNALESLDWNVDILRDANQAQIDEAVTKLKNRLSTSSGSYGFVFYAGHAVQESGINYLIPVDANYQSASALKSRAVSVQTLLDELNDAGNELNIVVLDACRDNPFSWNRSGSRGLVVVEHQPANSIIAFATSEHEVAADGDGRNGLYTTHLLNNLKTPGISVHELFNKTGTDVIKASGGNQRPALYQKFFGTAYLGSKPQQNPNPTPNPSPAASLYDQLANAKGTVTITVKQDAALTSSVKISSPSSVTLRGDTAGRTVVGMTVAIRVESGVTLTLENITLLGVNVCVYQGGTLVMNEAATITSCTSFGVFVEGGGTFIMNNGSSITKNKNSGVNVRGVFTMNNGRIANNESGGVWITEGGTFIMRNGNIEHNGGQSLPYGGFSYGGVKVIDNSRFYMQGGSITGNKGDESGGVSVDSYFGLFKMTGGVIYGKNEGSNANRDKYYNYSTVWDNGKSYEETIYRYER